MLRRQERRAAGEGVTEGGRPRPLQSPSPRLLPRSPPAASCQASGHPLHRTPMVTGANGPHSPQLSQLHGATWRLRVKSPETQTGARRLREWCRPPWEPSRGSETEEWRPAPRRCAHPGRGEAGSEGEGGGDAETHGHSPAVALGTVFSLAQKLHRTQMSASSLQMWRGRGSPHGLRGGEGRRAGPSGGQGKAGGAALYRGAIRPPRTRPPPSSRQGPGSLGAAREGCQGGYEPQLCGEPRGHTAAYLRPVPLTHTDTLTHFVLVLAHTHTHKP